MEKCTTTDDGYEWRAGLTKFIKCIGYDPETARKMAAELSKPPKPPPQPQPQPTVTTTTTTTSRRRRASQKHL
jgi:hypothetical protein